ncbi:unnamed protein product [Calicophoron daubneyi]|uniref:Sodium-dependent multivitamin transporter n=1 Tax=Calicophoron daubneyi TaxID=300641 RepID=A0AAV2TD52_CALDB
MSFAFDWPDYVVFGFWLVLYSLIGLYHRFRNEILSTINKCFGRQRQENVNEEDAEALFLGNRNLSLLPVLASLMASFLSAVALMGTTSEIYLYGIQFVFLIFGYLIAFPVAAEVYMPVFYKLKLNSAHEYLEFRFGKSIRWLTSLAFCIQMLVYTALALYAPSLAFSQVSGIPVWITVLSTGIVTTFYTTLGGIRAVVWIDLLQLILLTSGMLVAVIIGTVRIGGPQKLIEIAWTGKRLQTFDFNVNPLLHHTFWTLALGGAGMVLSIFGTNQTQVQRYLSCRNMETARRATLLNLPSNAVFLILEIIFGLVMYAYFSQCDPLQTGEVKKADQLLPYIIMVLFDGIPIIRGLFLSVIFAAALSTVSSGINSLAQVFLEDLIRPCLLHFRKKDLERRVQTYVAVLLSGFLGAVSVGLALLMQILSSGVLNFSFSLFGAIGGPILAVFTLGMIMPCINWKVMRNTPKYSHLSLHGHTNYSW